MSGFDAVPWVIGGQGIKHDGNIARVLAYCAFGGSEGIVGTRDLEVAPTATPGPNVRIMPGAGAVKSKVANTLYEAYAIRLPGGDTTTVAITPTGSGAGRCDLLVAIVENPYVDTSIDKPTAQQIADGTAVFVRVAVITMGVSTRHPNTAEIVAALASRSAIPLASVLQPASNGTVQASMIRSQRRIASFRTQNDLAVVNPVEVVQLTGTTPKTIAKQAFVAPEWATHCSVRAMLSGAKYNNPGTSGIVRTSLTSAIAGVATQYGENIAYDSQSTNPDRIGLMAAGRNIPIAPEARGNGITVAMEGTKNAGQQTVTIDRYTAVTIDIAYYASPESNFPLLTFA